jgi:hypothetical protein
VGTDTGLVYEIEDASSPPVEDRKVVGIFPARARASRQRLFLALEQAFPVRFEERADGQWAGLHGALVFGSGTPHQDAPCPLFLAPDLGPNKAGATDVEFATAQPLDKRLRGRRMAEARTLDKSQAQFLPTDMILASSSGAPVWARRHSGKRWCDVAVAAPPDLAVDEMLREQLVPGRWLATLPLIHFLREIVGKDGWVAPPIRAAYVFDDPNLHTTRYGYIRFRELADHANRHGYHACFASIPLDYGFASPRTVEIFRENAQVLSLCVHGNNHVADELSRVESDRDALIIAAQALRRTAALEARTGIEVSRVMVPPYEACSEQMMRGLFRVGFESLCIETPFHRRCGVSTPPSWTLAEWYAGDFVAGGLPAIPRYPMDRTNDELVLRAFLDQPLILYGHHQDVAAGLEGLAAIAADIAAFGDVSWLSLRGISRSNYMTRRQGSRLRIRPLSRHIILSGFGDVDEVVVEVPETASATMAVQVRSGEQSTAWRTVSSGSIAFKGWFGGPVAIELAPIDLVSAESVASPPWRPWPIARRILTEARDRTDPLRSRF